MRGIYTPTQKDWSRNLIVVSSFGLTLDRILQKSTLPFRDTYQTAIYLATLMALERDPKLGDKYGGLDRLDYDDEEMAAPNEFRDWPR